MPQQFWHAANLPFVESRRAWVSRACYKAHTHHTLSIGAVDAGQSHLTVDGAEAVALQAGDVVVIPAHCVHACNPAPDAFWSYQMLYLDCAWLASLSVDDARVADLLQVRQAVHLRTAEIYRQYCALQSLLAAPVSDSEKEEALVELLGQLLLPTEPPAQQAPLWLAPLLDQLQRQCEAEWSLAAMAQQVGLSRYHFIRVFRAHAGLTPHAYVLDCRINLARTLLRDGFPLSELAYRLGFSDQSHFQHAFRARVSVTPGEYQRQCAQ
jgi:AraC-like DNA-binding protein